MARAATMFAAKAEAGELPPFVTDTAAGPMKSPRAVEPLFFKQGMTFNVEGGLQPDQGLRDDKRAALHIQAKKDNLGSVWFKRDDLLAVFCPPPNPAPGGAEPTVQAAAPDGDAPDAPPQTADQRPTPTNTAVRQWFRDRVAGWPLDQKAPSQADDWAAAQQYFAPGLSRDNDFRVARKEETPPAWRKQGPRKPWVKKRQLPINSAILRTKN